MSRTLLLVLVLLTTPAFAAADARGDAAAGKTLAYTCSGCHGVTGWKNPYPNYHVPKIGGQNYEYLVSALTEYRDGGRKHPTMNLQGQALGDAEIHDIAAFLAGLQP